MKDLTEWIQETLKISPDLQKKIFTTLIIILILWLVRTIIMKIVQKRTEDAKISYQWRKSSVYLSVFIGLLLVGRVWFENFQIVTTYFGLLSAGIAIALKDLVSSIAGWFFIISRKPINVGDRIQIGEFRGDVIDIRIFKFTLMEIGNWVDADQSTGRIIHIPNHLILSKTLANYSKGFQYIWNEIPVLITFESNWKKAKEILLQIVLKHAEHLSKSAEKRLKKAAKKFMIFYTTLTPTVYTSVEDSGVLLTIRYLCEPRRRRGSEQVIWEDILSEFAGHTDIDFAYPTQRFYNNISEGKPEIVTDLIKKRKK